MKKETFLKLIPAVVFIMLILCLITKSDALLIAAALCSAVCTAVCAAFAGKNSLRKEKNK